MSWTAEGNGNHKTKGESHRKPALCKKKYDLEQFRHVSYWFVYMCMYVCVIFKHDLVLTKQDISPLFLHCSPSLLIPTPQLDPRSLNNTAHHNRMTLMFNRVPKVGSQSTMELLRTLSYKNGFTFHKDRPQKVENIKLTNREQVSTTSR